MKLEAAVKGGTSLMHKDIKMRTELHLSRKIFHILGIGIVLFLFLNLSRKQSLTALGITTLLFIPIDFLRMRSRRLGKAFISAAKPLIRTNELEGLTASSHLLLGMLIVIAIFPENIAVLSLLLLAFGDPVSSIVGVKFGKDKIIGNKSLQGTFAGFVVCSIVAYLFYYYYNIMTERIVLVSILTGVIGAVSEIVPIGKMDDNFSFPIIAALLTYGLFNLFGGFA